MTTNFSIVTSDAGPSTPTPTSTNTVRLNAPAVVGTRYMSTPNTNAATQQEWAWWWGRRGQAATAANSMRFWLYANESDLTNNTVDGYCVLYGDDTGGDDLFLQVVTNGVFTTILTSTGTTANAITDIGFTVRVSWSNGVWRMFSSPLPQATGGGTNHLADPRVASTEFQGSVTNTSYTPTNGHLGVAVLHSTGAGAIIGMEFDQIFVSNAVVACVPAGAVTFIQQTNHYAKFSNGGDIFNSGGTQMGMWANTGSRQAAAWRNFRTEGSGGGEIRSLQPGDRFRITLNGPNPNGLLGVSINENAATGSWDNRTNNTRGFIQVQGGGANDYFVMHAGGTPSWSGVRPNSTDQTLVFDILSTREFTANIEGQTPKYDLTMLNSPADTGRVNGFSVFLNNDTGDIFWKQVTLVTNLGFVLLGADNGTRTIMGTITDSTDPACADTIARNQLRKSGTGTITLNSTSNTYSLGTRIEAGTLAVYHDGNLGAVPGSHISTNIEIYSSAALRATNTFTLNANRGIWLGNVNGPTISVDAAYTLTYGGILGGNADWNKAGGGTLALTGTSSTNSGRVSIQDGSLRIAGDGSLGAVPASGGERINIWSTGTFEADGTFTLHANRRIELGAVNGPRLSVTAGNTLTYGGQISGSANWSKEGAGTLTLTGAVGSASGTLAVNAGAVIFNGTNTSQSLVVSPTGFLYGAGSIDALTVTGQISAGAASNTVGNLRASSFTLQPNGRMQVNFSAMTGTAGTDWDVITVGGGSGTYTVNSSAGNEFVIALKGNPTFDNTQGYTNIIVDAGTASGFNTNKFTITTAEFTPALGGGSFSLDAEGGDLRLIFTPAAAASPDIAVLGTNGAVIANNDVTPTITDGTDFGSVLWSGSYAVTNVFSITNSGNANLTISGITTNSTMGAGADFLVLSFPGTVSPGARSNLVIAFNPSAAGVRTASVVIANNDTTKNPYVFVVQGTGAITTATVVTTVANPTNLTTAVSGGNVTDDGGATVTNRGVVWATTSGPTVPGAQTTNGTGTGAYTSTLTNLLPGVTYFYRAFAQNSAGTSYGAELSLQTPCFTNGPTVSAASDIGYTNFTANWNATTGATGYRLDVSTNPAFNVLSPNYGIEAFTNIGGGTSSSYLTRQWTNNGVAWTAFLARTDQTINGEALTLQNAVGSYLISQVLTGGVDEIRVVHQLKFTGADSFDIFVNSTRVATNIAYSATVQTAIVQNIGISGDFTIMITNKSGGRVALDDLSWSNGLSVGSFVPGYSNRAVSGISQLVTGLTDGVTYYYRVRAEGGGSCVSPNSGTQTVTTLAYDPPGIGIGGNLAATSTVGGAATLSFTVTNVGQRLLSYHVTNDAPTWLVISPTSGTSIATGGTQAHTLTLWATNLAAGVHTGRVVVFNTGTGPNAATNSPRAFDVLFTVNAITPVTSAGATNDGNELIRLGWTKAPAFDVLVLHRQTNAPATPANGTLYNLGDTISGGTRVIYKGAATSLQHVVRTGSTNFYAFYSIYSNFYSTIVSASATTGVYAANEIVEAFAYTSGVVAANLAGGAGWGTNAWMGNTNRFSASNLSFATQAEYPVPRANKIAVSPSDSETLGITRRLATPIGNGQLYVAYIVNFEFGGPGKYVGVQLFSNTTERLFAGEVSTADLRLGIDGTASTRVMTNGLGHDYVVILRYDWAAGQAVASAYKIGTDTVPAEEPLSWDITLSKASNTVGWINTIRLVSGTTGSGTPGATYFDEVRVATNWYQLLQIAPPTGTIIYDGFSASAGTLAGGGGGTGWSNTWTLGGDPFADYSAGSFALSNSSYAITSGNKVVFYGDVDGRWISATRSFAEPKTNGAVYFSWIQNYQFNGVNKYAGLRLMQDSTEKAFIGKVSSGDQTFGISDSSANATSSVNLAHGIGNDYVIVAKYDFETRELSATSYKIGSETIAEEPDGYWQVTTTQTASHITSLTGVRLAIGAGPGVQVGYVYFDEIRVGTNWFEVTRRDGLAQAPAMGQGPIPRLLYVGTNYNPVLNPQGSLTDITVTDADLANANDPLDVAVLWSNSFGVFITNANGSLNFGSRAGRVNPNFDPVVLASTGSQFQSLGFDAVFTNRRGVNGAITVTTFQHQAFTITNISFGDSYFITLSAENNNMGGGTVAAPNGADPIPYWRALTVNTALQFFVQDDDPNPPEIFEFTIDGVGGSGSSNLLPGAIAIIGVNGAGSTDRFSFVTLAPFPSGTRFLFTDCGWDANSNNWYNLAEFHTNTWVASGNIDVGTVIELTLTNLNSAGDQVVVYQYAGPSNPTNDPDGITFLTAINLGPGWFTNLAYPGGGTNNQNSMLYRGLTNGVNAVSVPIGSAANARYIGPTTGTASFILSQVMNATNWQSFSSGYINITNYAFNIIGPGSFDWNTPELSDAQVLAGGYRVTNIVRDLESGIIATSKPYGHAPYFKLYNTGGVVIVSNMFSVNFADGTKTPVTNRMSAPPGVYSAITLGLVESVTATADNDNDRLNDTLFRTNRAPVLIYDDDPDAPVVGTNGVRVLIGAGAVPATNRVELVAGWNFNVATARTAVSAGSGTMLNTITTTNSNTGTTLNAYESDPAGDDLTVQAAANIGRSIGFVIDMTGRRDLVVSFAAQRSATGYDSNVVAFAVGTGAFVTVNAAWNPPTSFAVQTFDLSSYPEINGAASVLFRITFGTNANSGAGNNRFDNFQFNAGYQTYYEVTDGQLATVGVANPLRFSFNAYDVYSGLARGTANDGTNMAVTIGGLATNNTGAYQASLSSANTTNNVNATSVWQFASMTSSLIGELYADGKSNRAIRATMGDADNDRPGDTAYLNDALFGVWRVIDDDTNTPVLADVAYPNAASRPFIVLTNGGTFAASETVRGLNRRSGSFSNTVWTLTDGDLAASGTIGLQFSFGARDVHSGVSRGNTGDTNTVMSFSLGSVMVGNFSNYNAGLSTTQTTTNQFLTNVWSFGAGTFSDTYIGTLMATNIGVNPLATTTRAVRVTIPDTDDDRPNDRATLIAQQVGFIRIADDDARGPVVSSAIAEGTTGNEQSYLETFEPAQGWTNILSFSGSWTNTVSNGTYIASGSVLWGSLNPKVSGTRRIGLLTNEAGTATWLQLPGVKDPGTFTVFAGRFGGEDPTNDVAVWLERLEGTVWTNLGTNVVSALNPEFEMLSWNVNVDGVVTLRLVRAALPAAQVYMDDINITPNPEWVSTNSLTIRWAEGVDDFSGVDEYRLVMPAVGNTTPTATNAGLGLAASVTSHTASIVGQQGVITGFVFAIDDDNDRPADRALGNLKPIVVRVDTNPPPVMTNLRATDASAGLLFDGNIDETSEIKVEWRPGGTNEAQAAGWRQSDSAALSPWDSYLIRYYEVSDTNGTPAPGAVTVSLSRSTAGWTNVLNNWAFTNLVLSNLQFDTYYRIEIQGRDVAGNIGLVTSVIGNTDRFVVTQGLTRADKGLDLKWTGPVNESVLRDYDVLYIDATHGFRNTLTSQWTFLQYTNRPRLVDTGAVGRLAPGLLTGTTYRLYRVARKDRWQTNLSPRVGSAEIYAAKAVRLHPGENWYSLFSFPDPATDGEMESTVAYVFGTNTLPAGTTYASSTRITWFGGTTGVNFQGSAATSIVWLSSSAGWQYHLGGSGAANNKRVPLGQGFLIELPSGSNPTNLVLVGQLPTQALVRTIPAVANTNVAEFHVLSHQMTERIAVSNFVKQFSGFVGGVHPNFADEIRVLNNQPIDGVSQGSLIQPRMRIWLSTIGSHASAPWRQATSGSPSGMPSAMGLIIEPDDTVIIVRRKDTTVGWTNAPTYSAPTKNFSP